MRRRRSILRSKNDALQKELGKYVERITELQRIVISQPLYEYMAKYINKTNAVSGRKRKADEAFASRLFDVNESDDDEEDEVEEPICPCGLPWCEVCTVPLDASAASAECCVEGIVIEELD